MKINVFKNTNYFGGIIIVLAFAVLYSSLIFFFYIPQQENKLQQRAFRILKEYGKNMFGQKRLL